MKRILSWIIMVPFAIAVIVFSAVNRDLVTLSLWPFPHELTVPVFSMVLAVFIVGFLWGGIVAWLSAGETRRRARNNMWRAETAERELRSVTNKLHAHEREVNDARDDADRKLPATTPGG